MNIYIYTSYGERVEPQDDDIHMAAFIPGCQDDAAVCKAVSKEEAQTQLWKAVTTVRPSPRNPNFHQCMKDAVWMIENGCLKVDSFWTKCYNRDTEWQQAFADGANRPSNYSRGYIKWD